jgi:hypothetical protein
VVWAIAALFALPLCHALHTQIPSIDESNPRPHDAAFIFSSDTQIVVLSGFSKTESPSLLDYASTFRTDLQSILALASPPPLSVRQPNFPAPSYPVIVLATGAANFSYFSGQQTSEGYTIDVAQKRVTIRGVDAPSATRRSAERLHQADHVAGGRDPGLAWLARPWVHARRRSTLVRATVHR